MRSSIVALRTPLIRFLGPRTAPSVDHTPRAHPQASAAELPSSFKQYRQSSQTHGPLGRASGSESTGSAAGAVFQSIADLPERFHYKSLSLAELDCINSGGAEIAY